jgi:hypothetical protein
MMEGVGVEGLAAKQDGHDYADQDSKRDSRPRGHVHHDASAPFLGVVPPRAGTRVASGVLAVGRTTVTPRGKITGPALGD